MNGFDKYLEYQFHLSGAFYTSLFATIAVADSTNRAKLAKGFPEEVEADRIWTTVGVEGFLARCSVGHPLIEKARIG